MLSSVSALLLASLIASAPLCGEPEALEPLLRANETLRALLTRASEHRLQIVVSEVVEGAPPCLRRRVFRADAEYFYPASAIKLGGAVAAARWLERHEGVGLEHPLIVEAATVAHDDGPIVISPTTKPQSLETTLEETLVVSSNSAFNRLFDLVGRDELNGLFWDAGYSSVRFRHRLASRGFPRSAQRYAPPVRRTGGQPLEPLREARLELPPNSGMGQRLGVAHVSPDGDEIAGPLPFEDRNAVSLLDLHDTLIAVIRPELAPRPLPLSPKNRAVLREIMGRVVQIPPKAGAPPDRVRYKPLLAGFRRGVRKPDAIHFENKAGRAYGFLIDNGYVRDGNSGRELFVTAVIYVNANGIIGDDTYEYATTGLGFFEALGEQLARETLR